jgi:hypothetical protein
MQTLLQSDLAFLDSTADPELASAIEILTAASRTPLAPSTSLNLPTPSANESSIPPFNNLSDAEVESLRALIGQPVARGSSTPQAEDGKGDVDEAAFGRVRVSLENVAEAVREMERGCEVSMRIGESHLSLGDRPLLVRVLIIRSRQQVESRTEDSPVPRPRRRC